MSQEIVLQHAVLDASHFPVVAITEFGALTDLDRVRLTDALLDLLQRRRERHGVILDLTRGGPMPDVQRTYVAEALEAHAAEIVERWIGVAVIVREPVLRNVPTASFWLKMSRVPARMFTDAEAAVDWIQACANLSATGAIPIVRPTATSKRGTR